MKKLIFVRHGKAEDLLPDIHDFERSLTLRGKTISREMARSLMKKTDDPGILITSPAFRALETALIFAMEYGIAPEKVRMADILYTRSDLGSLLTLLSTVNEESDTVTIFGHNPAFTLIPNSLCTESIDTLPKSGVICLSFRIKTWQELHPDSGKIEFLLKP